MARLLLRGTLLGPGFSGTELLSHPSSTAARSLEAVLFDKDGTLCRSEPMLVGLAQARIFCCRSLLSERYPQLAGTVLPALELRLEATYGLRDGCLDPAGTTAVASREHNLISTATALAQAGMGWPEALELAEEVFARTDVPPASSPVAQPQATAGLHELIERLRDSGVACAVISNDEREGIEAFLEREKLRSHFQALRSAGDRPHKPDPAAVSALCSELGVDPLGCALIGDANSDLVMAERAGVGIVLGYTAGWQQRPPLQSRFPQLAHWRELEVRSA